MLLFVPFVTMPCVCGNNPVKMDAREGMQIGAGQYARLNVTPSEAMRSRCGVEIGNERSPGTVSQRCWSVSAMTTFGERDLLVTMRSFPTRPRSGQDQNCVLARHVEDACQTLETGTSLPIAAPIASMCSARQGIASAGERCCGALVPRS